MAIWCSFFEILGFPIRRVSLSNSLVTFDNEGFQSVLSNWSFKGGDGGQINPPRFGTENMLSSLLSKPLYQY